MTDSHPSELLIRQRLAALARTLPSASGGDVNAIHQARVATRRVRDALPIVTPRLQATEAEEVVHAIDARTRRRA